MKMLLMIILEILSFPKNYERVERIVEAWAFVYKKQGYEAEILALDCLFI